MLNRGNSIFNRLFSNSVHSIQQLASNDSEAKGMCRFLQNDHVSEDNIIRNMSSNCAVCAKGRSVLCIQDTSEVNLYNHRNRNRKDRYIGTTNAGEVGLGFFVHPTLLLDSETLMPFGFADTKLWNRILEPQIKDPKPSQEGCSPWRTRSPINGLNPH